MNRLRIIPLDDTVVFPGMPITVPVDVGSEDRVFLVSRHDNTYAKVGVVADVSERVRLAGRGLFVELGVVVEHISVSRAEPRLRLADMDLDEIVIGEQ